MTATALERVEVRERFWAKVNRDGPVMRAELGPCWVWTDRPNSSGYGALGVGGRTMSAHRISWLISNGDIPAGLSVLHHCDNPPCVRPDHLFLGTHAENMRDMVAKGRARSPMGEAHGNSKLTALDATSIRLAYARGEMRQRGLAHRHGVTQALVGRIIRREIWRHSP